jgi:hypothetical protein
MKVMRDFQVLLFVLFLGTSSIVTGLSANMMRDIIKTQISSAFAFHPSFNPIMVDTAGGIEKADGLISHEIKERKRKVNKIYLKQSVYYTLI